jgi:hypothetical protein
MMANDVTLTRKMTINPWSARKTTYLNTESCPEISQQQPVNRHPPCDEEGWHAAAKTIVLKNCVYSATQN